MRPGRGALIHHHVTILGDVEDRSLVGHGASLGNGEAHAELGILTDPRACRECAVSGQVDVLELLHVDNVRALWISPDIHRVNDIRVVRETPA